jgi:hypothetical protein
MNISFQVYDEEGVSEYVQSLKKIEKNISYPLENGTESFRISHGKAYTTFFTNQGYKTRFLIRKLLVVVLVFGKTSLYQSKRINYFTLRI